MEVQITETDLRTATEQYLKLGLSVIPYKIENGERKPLVKWKARELHVGPCDPGLINWILERRIQDGSPHGIGIFGGTREGILICDSEEVEFHRELIKRLGDSWTVDTSNRGGHVYFRVIDPATGELVPIESRSFRARNKTICDFIGQSKWAVAPPSIHHKTGRQYQTTNGDPGAISIVKLSDLEFLETVYGIEIIPASVAHERARPAHIPSLAWDILRGVLPCPTSKQRAHHEYRAVLSLIVHGIDWPGTLEAFSIHAHEGTHFQSRVKGRGLKDATEWLHRSFEKGQKNVREQFLSPVRLDLEYLIQRLENIALKNDKYGIKRALLLACANIGFRADTTKIAPGRRRLALTASVSEKSVTKYIEQLVNEGFLKRIKADTDEHATIYEIETGLFGPLMQIDLAETTPGGRTPLKPLPPGGTSGVHRPGEGARFAVAALYHDVFRYRALGKIGFAVWSELKDCPDGIEPLKMRIVAEGVHNSTVYKKIRNMEKALMVERRQGRVYIREDADLERAAKILGVHGIGDRVKRRHDRERKTHRRKLEEKQKYRELFETSPNGKSR